MITIASFEVFSFTLPLAAELRTARGALPTGTGRPVVLVRLTASDGTVGWGEGSPLPQYSPETRETCISTLGRYFCPALLRKPLADLDGLHRAMDHAIAPLVGPSMPIARAALDLAAHDALCKSLRIPLRDLLGHRRADHVRLSWTVTGATVSEVEDSLQSARTRGFRHCKLSLGGKPEWDLRLVKVAGDTFPDGFLHGDAHGAFAPHEALPRIAALAEAGLSLLEQPLAPDRPDLCARLVERSPIPVALDQPVTGPAPLMSLVQQRALSACVLKVTRTGGLLPSRRCAELAEAAGLLLTSAGLTDAGVAFAANAQLAAAFGLHLPCALDGPQLLAEDVLATPLPREGDLVKIPEKPGLGIDVDEDKVRRLASKTGGTLHRTS